MSQVRYLTKYTFLSIAALLLTACSIINEQMYQGELKEDSEHVVLSALGLYPEKRISLQVTAIDGVKVNRTRAASFYLLPGTYEIEVHATRNFNYTGGAVSYQQADLTSTLTAEKGHTYIPNVIASEEMAKLTFEDKGENFPQECLPLYVTVNNSKNPGHAIHKDGRKCEL